MKAPKKWSMTLIKENFVSDYQAAQIKTNEIGGVVITATDGHTVILTEEQVKTIKSIETRRVRTGWWCMKNPGIGQPVSDKAVYLGRTIRHVEGKDEFVYSADGMQETAQNSGFVIFWGTR